MKTKGKEECTSGGKGDGKAWRRERSGTRKAGQEEGMCEGRQGQGGGGGMEEGRARGKGKRKRMRGCVGGGRTCLIAEHNTDKVEIKKNNKSFTYFPLFACSPPRKPGRRAVGRLTQELFAGPGG